MEWLNERKAEMGFPVRDSLRECIEKGKPLSIGIRNGIAPGTKRLPNGRMHGMAFTWTHEWEDSSGSGEIAIRIERTDGTAKRSGHAVRHRRERRNGLLPDRGG